MPLKISIFFQPLPRFFFILNIIFVIWVVLLSFLAPIGQKRYQILPFESLHHLADRKSYNILIWQKYGIRQKRKASNVENRFSRSVGRLPENIMFQLVFYYNGYGSHLSSLWILYTPNQGQIGKLTLLLFLDKYKYCQTHWTMNQVYSYSHRRYS